MVLRHPVSMVANMSKIQIFPRALAIIGVTLLLVAICASYRIVLRKV